MRKTVHSASCFVALRNAHNPSFTGTITGIDKSDVGLTNVDNTADASKPVSTAMQAALDLKQDDIVNSTDLDMNILTIGNQNSNPRTNVVPKLFIDTSYFSSQTGGTNGEGNAIAAHF